MQFAVIIRMLSGNVIFLTPVIAATSGYSTLSKSVKWNRCATTEKEWRG